jgi:hypothetical protein
MLALDWLAVLRASLAEPPQPGQPPDARLTTSANEIRHMFTALCGPPPDEQHPVNAHNGAIAISNASDIATTSDNASKDL